MLAIYKREVRAYFHSMVGWMFTAVLTAFIGIYFMAYNLFQGDAYFSTALGATLFVLMVLVPILTMRCLAEERRSRTDQLLLTAPVPVASVVLGKYFAMLTVLAAPTLIACLCPLIIRLNGTSFLLADYATILAFFLLGAVEIGVGMLISSLTESQLLSAVGTFGLLLVLYLWDGLVDYLPATASGSLAGLLMLLVLVCLLLGSSADNWVLTLLTLATGAAVILGGYLWHSDWFSGLLPSLLGKFSLLDAFDSFSVDHVFDLRGLLLYGSLIVLLVFLTVQVLQKRRWN